MSYLRDKKSQTEIGFVSSYHNNKVRSHNPQELKHALTELIYDLFIYPALFISVKMMKFVF